jgi:RNA polymerase sigma-70 factor (ECF subfamily)
MGAVRDPKPAADSTDDVDARLARLAPAAARGDAAAFREVVTLLMPTLWRIASRMVDDATAAEDVVQMAIVKVWKSLPSIADPRATRAFACATLRHVAIDEQRKFARRRTVAAGALDDDTIAVADHLMRATPDATTLLETAEAKALVQTALQSLSEDHRIVLLLCDVDGVTQADAAIALGVKLGTVASRLSRARSALSHHVRALQARPARRTFPWQRSRP